jgi:hypothetical protein
LEMRRRPVERVRVDFLTGPFFHGMQLLGVNTGPRPIIAPAGGAKKRKVPRDPNSLGEHAV